nr:hypothetical protein [Tanacetum cinerariifolium]
MTLSSMSDNSKYKAVNEEKDDSLVRAVNTASSLEAKYDSGVKTPQSDEDSLKLKELMELCITLQSRVLALEQTKATQANEIDSLKRRGRISDIDADEELKHTKPKAKAKGIVFHEPEESTIIATTEIITKSKSCDKGKGIMVEEPVKLKKKDQIQLDEEVALKLQAEFNKEQRLVGERAQQEKEANIALIETWDEKRRKFFAAKRAEEKRKKPPPQAQQRKNMCTYLKNMKGKKLTDLKNKSFDSIQNMFDRAFKRVNTFVDFRTKLVKESSKKAKAEVMEQESSKRAGTEQEQESSKKQNIDDDKETTSSSICGSNITFRSPHSTLS